MIWTIIIFGSLNIFFVFVVSSLFAKLERLEDQCDHYKQINEHLRERMRKYDEGILPDNWSEMSL